MKNRREFLAGCAGVTAAALTMPAASVILGPADEDNGKAYGLAEFESLVGERIALREGCSVVVSRVDPLETDPRCEQFVVDMRPSDEMQTGLYHLQMEEGTRLLYLDAGGGEQPSLSATVNRLRV